MGDILVVPAWERESWDNLAKILDSSTPLERKEFEVCGEINFNKSSEEARDLASQRAIMAATKGAPLKANSVILFGNRCYGRSEITADYYVR